jgi:hypothetical protein
VSRAARCAEPSGPLALDELVGYLLGDLPEADLDAVEEHLFGCAACGGRLESVDAVRRAVADAARRAELGGNVGAAFLERAVRDGLSVREYRIPKDGEVACTAGPEDLVLVRLALDPARPADSDRPAALRLNATFEDLERGGSAELPAREVLADRGLGEVMLVFPGEAVRAYPRSRWTMRLADGATYVMDHTPAPGAPPPDDS